MNTETIVKVILYAPFVIMLFVFGGRYIKNGYKKGIIRSLVSLGATVGALVVSILVVRNCETTLTQKTLSWQPKGLLSDFGILEGVVKTGIQTVMKVVLTFGLFALVFVICLTVFKLLVKLITLGEGEGTSKLLGAAVGALDAALATFLVLLPLYGFLAFTIPPVAKVMETAQKPQIQATTALKEAQEHSLLKLYSKDAANAIYDGIYVFRIGGKAADPENVTRMVENIADMVQQLRSPGGNKEEIAQRLVGYLQENVTQGDLGYDDLEQWSGKLENSTGGELAEVFENVSIPQEFQLGEGGVFELIKGVLAD